MPCSLHVLFLDVLFPWYLVFLSPWCLVSLMSCLLDDLFLGWPVFLMTWWPDSMMACSPYALFPLGPVPWWDIPSMTWWSVPLMTCSPYVLMSLWPVPWWLVPSITCSLESLFLWYLVPMTTCLINNQFPWWPAFLMICHKRIRPWPMTISRDDMLSFRPILFETPTLQSLLSVEDVFYSKALQNQFPLSNISVFFKHNLIFLC